MNDVKVNIDTAKILRKRGLGDSKEATRFLAAEVERMCRPYVPFASGDLQNSAKVTDDSIIYNQPYAQCQYHGTATGQGDGMRGREWNTRMMADRGDEVRRSLANYVGGKAK